MNNPLVTIIIAVRNGESFIKNALESVFAQTYPSMEILVVDGHSTDGTREIVKEFDRVKIIDQSGKGIGNAYNTGILSAQGEFIAFLSSDDCWFPDKIERQITLLKKHPAAAFAVCRAEFFLDDPAYNPPGFRRELLDEPRVAFIMETLCARRLAFETIGLFNETIRTAEDVDWFARALDRSIESIVEPNVLLRKRIHDSNLHLDTVRQNRDLLSAIKNTLDRKQNLPNSIKIKLKN